MNVLFLRATPTEQTARCIRAAIDERRPIVPIYPDAPAHTEADLRARIAALPETSPLAFIATSGSTGTPKLVELSHEAFAAHAAAANQHLELRDDDRWLVTLPLAHTSGLSALVRCWAAGATPLVEVPPPLGPAWVAWLGERIQRQAVTRISVVPAQLDLLVEDRVEAPSRLRSVLVGGQAAPAALLVAAQALGWPIVASYGLTETCGMCVATRIGDDLGHGVVGRPIGDTQLRLRDTVDQTGLLEIHTSAQASAVHGASTPFSPDGWLHTSDRARLEPTGLRVLGRDDDLVQSGGHKIDPHEVEAALRTVPGVRDVLIVGVPERRFGAILAAAVVLDGADRLDRIRDQAARILPRAKRPRRWQVVPSLPRLPNGKLDRRAAARLFS